MDDQAPAAPTEGPPPDGGAAVAPPPRKKRTRRSRRAKERGCLWRLVVRSLQLAVMSVVLVLAVLVGWLRSDDFRTRAVKLLETVLEQQLGEAVTLTDVNVRFWPPGADVEGFHVFHAGDGETIVSAERIRVPLVLDRGRIGVGQLMLLRPTVALHVDEKGKLREFQHLPKRENPRPLQRLPFSGLRIIDGSVRVEFPDGYVSLEGIDALPTPGRTTSIDGTLSYRYRGLEESTELFLSDVVLGPERIEFPDLSLDLRVADADGRARLVLPGEIDAELTLAVDLEEVNPALTPPRAAHGTVDLDLRAEGTLQAPTIAIVVAGRHLGADVPGVFTPLLTYELGEIRAAAIATRDGVEVQQVVLPWADGRIVAWGRIDRDLVLQEGHVTAEQLRLLPLLKAFDSAPTPWVDFRGDAEITVSGPLKPLRLEGDFEFGVADLHVGDRPLEAPGAKYLLDLPHAHATGRIVLDKDHVVLDAKQVRGPRNAGTCHVDIGFKPKGPLDLTFDLTEADLSDFRPLAGVGLKGVGHVSGRIQGPFNKLSLQGRGDVRDFEVLGIEYADRLVADIASPNLKLLALENAQAQLGSSTYAGRYAIDFRPPISMQTAIRIDRGRVEDMVNMFVDLDGLRGDLTGSLWLDGPLFDMDGEAHLAFRDAELYGERFPVGEGHGYMDAGVFTLDDLRLRRDDGDAGITLRGSVDRKWALDMELVADGLRLQRLDRLAPYELPVEGDLSVQARITNTLFDPSPDGRIVLTHLRYANARAGDSVIDVDSTGGVAHYTGTLLGGAATVDGTLGLWGEQPYALVAKLRELPAHTFYPVAADGGPVRAVIDGTVAVSGHFGPTWSPVKLDSSLDRVDVGWGEHHLVNQRPWMWSQEGNVFAGRDIGLAGGATDVRFSVSGGGPDGLAASGSGPIDLDLLRAVVPGLDRSVGRAEVTLAATGARPDVQAVVQVDVAADVLRHSAAPVSLEDTTARLRVTRDRIEIEQLAGSLGGGTYSVGGGIDAEAWVPTRFGVSMDVADAQVQWVESLPPAIGDGHFTFDGPVGALLLSGDVSVSDMTFADRIDWEDWVVETREQMLVDPASTTTEEPMFSLNVRLAAAETVRLRNNLAEGSASADLRLIGDTVRPGLVGTATVHDGIAFLQDREFRIDRGVLTWNDPWSWDPMLDISLLTEIQNQDQRYRVDYAVQGPFSDWRATTRSDPALPQADVNALLWFGMTTDQLEAMGELPSAVVQGVADLIVTDFFVSGKVGELGQDLPSLFLNSRFDIATGVNARGQYSPEPRLVVENRVPDLDIDLKLEMNMVRPSDSYLSATRRIGGIWSLSGWYATLQRNRQLPIGGAYGVDVLARWELDR
jgi:hypothetical protein